MAKAEAFVTIKDHKENFPRNIPCRLINPAKPEIGVISRKILSGIVEALRDKPNINLWKNTSSVINWFKAIEEKASHTFVMFDIVDFYPSISENLLSLALAYAKQFVAIPDCDADIILHARQSLLFGANRTWAKKNRDGLFDVTMGSFDGAEACELVGAFLLGKLEQHFSSGSVGLYRDDGLAVLRNATGHSADKVRKAVIDTFKTLGLKITIDVNLNAVNYLDITMSLSTGTYQPYRKPNDTPLYVNVNSNHPPQVLKNIPAGINNRLASISCSEAVFRDAIPIYAEALNASGHPSTLEFKQKTSKKKKRKRKVIWYNPPYSRNVKTNIGGRFLALIKKHFPPQSKLGKIFTKNTIKISYSCMPNMAARIKSHNKAVLCPQTKKPEKPCNCRDKPSCPLHGECQTTEMIYVASITSGPTKKEYTGMSAPPFKSRHANHITTTRYEKYSSCTEFSNYIWKLKKSNAQYEVEWRIKDRARAYSNITKRCSLCTREKYHILNTLGSPSSLNKRSEMVSKCRHENKYLLKNHGVT